MLAGTGLPATAQEPLTMEDAGSFGYSDDNAGWDVKQCPKVTGKGKRKDCLQTADGSVRVTFGKSSATPATVREVIRTGWEGMRRYRDFGFSAAAISRKNPLVIAIEPGDGNPLYSWKSGVVYIGEGSAAKLGGVDGDGSLSARMELWHEQFHWIQDEAYRMGAARLFGADTWWMETGAEVATFLIEPAGAPRNARLYGHSTIGGANVSQLSPFQWPGDEIYQHAQRLLVAMYGPDPVLTPVEFVRAVDTGSYPFSDAGRVARFRAGLDDYAEYLISGELPGFGTVGPIADGTAFGDFIGVVAERSKPAGEGLRLVGNNTETQIDHDAKTVRAEMQPDSVYVLAVVSGSRYAAWDGTYPPAEPARLVIEPGPPFLFRLDGGPIIEHAGSAEFVIEPIDETGGIGEVRIVAKAVEAATFRAYIEPVELEPGGTASLVHTLRNLDAGEQGTTELVCTYDGRAVLEMADGWWQVTYEGEGWHTLEGARFVCGGGGGDGAILASGDYTTGPLAFSSWGECDLDTFAFEGEVLSGTTHASCGDGDVYTWEVALETLLEDD
ncbi:MAG: hypothetical protein AB1Z66_11960 [Candidatus Limnocylindrales bacterium]